MKFLNLQQTQELFGGQLVNAHSHKLYEVNSLKLSQASSVSFLTNEKYIDDLRNTKAGLIIVNDKFNINDDKAYLKHPDPSAVFSKITDYFAPEEISYPCGIHPTAIIDASVEIADQVHIGAYVIIEANCQISNGVTILPHTYIGMNCSIGDDSLIYSNVSIRERCQIGKRCIIQCNSVVGSDGFGFIPGKNGHTKIPQVGNVILEDDVELGANTVVDRARFASTIIGEGTKIDNLVQVAHNVVIGKHSFIAAQAGVAGSVEIGDFVQLGGQCGIVGHLSVGNGVAVSGNSVVTKDVADGNFVTSTIPAVSRREHVARLSAHKKVDRLIKKLDNK